MKFSSNLLFLVAVLLLFSCQGEKKEPVAEKENTVNYLTESKEDFNTRMEWWRDARYGMFVHWGVYSVPAGEYNGEDVKGIGEWIMQRGQIPVDAYEAFAKQFDPQKFDANEWVKIIKDAGMKYLVITSKHHDGFAIWDSKVSDYDIVDYAPYGKDILKALSEACKEQGIKFGLYHSIMDWHHADAQRFSYLKDDPKKREDNTANFADYYENYMKVQLKELIDQYDPDIMWFDGEWVGEFTHEQGLDLYQYVRSLKPEILINNRVDKGRNGMQGMNKEGDAYAGDFGTPEQEILENASALDWESCMTMNDTWGFKKNDHNWKSAEVLIHNLIDVTAKGGNYLLNVGPTSEGLIPIPSVERLKATGDWLMVNGEAIYQTQKLKGDYKQGESIRFTKKKGEAIIYIALLEQSKGELIVKNISPKEGGEIKMLGVNEPLDWEMTSENELKIKIPANIISTWNEHTHAQVIRVQGKEKI